MSRTKKTNSTNSEAAEPDGASKSRELVVEKADGMSRDRALAAIAMSSVTTATAVALDYFRATFGDISLNECTKVLGDSVARVQDGNMVEVEALLMAQAVALNSIFTELGRRAAPVREGQTFDAMERYLRLAQKAQAQCRATLETLSVIKNPPVVITRQANIANGPQQMNNGPNTVDEAAPARAANSGLVQNELLGEHYGERLDTGKTSAIAASDPTLAPVGAVDGAKNRSR